MHFIQHWTPLHIEKNKVTPIREVVKLPVFPEFKKLTLDDRHIIEEFVKQHPPYSDFNFTSLWCWNTNDTTMYSYLNKNLVFKMTDYSSNEVIYSLLGHNSLSDTLKKVVLYSKAKGIYSLKFIPEELVLEANKMEFAFEEDMDHHDYVYNIDDIISLNGSSYKIKRKKYNKFIRENDFQLRVVNLGNVLIQNEIKRLLIEWRKFKPGENNQDFDDYKKEEKAISRSMQLAKYANLLCVAIFLNDKMVGFSISEKIHRDYYMAHFQKTHLSYKGMYEYLFVETAKVWAKLGCKYINCQQDIGIQGLRLAKKEWNPTKYLKKYKLDYKDKAVLKTTWD